MAKICPRSLVAALLVACGPGAPAAIGEGTTDPPQTTTSTADPTGEPPPVCGDSIVDDTEECDDGDQDDANSCTNVCTLARCGDGILGAGEGCDDSNVAAGDGCSGLCKLESCGNGIVDAGEACDEGAAAGDSCTTLCRLPVCGDGLVTPSAGEQCDDGNQDDTDACVAGCMDAKCGDGFLGPGEACDDGNQVDVDACSSSCAAPGCGDGIKAGDEECDDGNDVATDACTTSCKLPVCGDGLVTPSAGEQCDDANGVDTDGCVMMCVLASCGDGFVRAGVEECDDGNADDGDACLNTCKLGACDLVDPNTCPGNSKVELVAVENINIAIDNNGDKWDSRYDGTLPSMLCIDLLAPVSELQWVGGMSLEVGLDHTYVGDLTIKIVSPDNKIFTPLSRPGSEPSQPFLDDGIPCCGDDSNVNAAIPFTFTDSALISGKDMGKAPLGANGTICKDEAPKIDPCQFRPYPGLAPGKDFDDFKGANAAGTWKVCIGDSGTGDFGLLQYLGLSIVRVKFPPK